MHPDWAARIIFSSNPPSIPQRGATSDLYLVNLGWYGGSWQVHHRTRRFDAFSHVSHRTGKKTGPFAFKPECEPVRRTSLSRIGWSGLADLTGPLGPEYL